MGVGGRPLAVLEKVRRDRPVVLHGVSLGIGSAEPLDPRYLKDWKALIERIEPSIVSDHLCWGRAHGRYSHDLLPTAFTEETLRHVVTRVNQVQDFLGRRIALENVSSYLRFAQSELTEWEFLAQVASRSGCDVLLDVNNIFVSSRNHGFDPDAYLGGVPVEKVVQIHLAGHQRRPELLIDTHDGPVSDEVWALYARALGRFGAVSTFIEWDDGVPELQTLLEEAQKARAIVPAPPPSSGEQSMPHFVSGPPRDAMSALQQTIFAAICDPTPVSAEAEALIAEHPKLSAKARLEVYAQMYWLRMRDVVRDSFPAVRAGLGDEHFDALVADFLRVHPSTHPSLDRLGRPFPAFLQTACPDWADVAALEWARAESFIAPDGDEIAFAQLQAVPSEQWGGLTLRAHPSVRVLVLENDPQPVLRAQRDGQPLPAVVKTPTALVVWRKGFVVFHAEIAAREAEALHSLTAGAALPVLLCPFEELEDGGVAAFEALQSWFSEGMVSSLSQGGSGFP